MRRLAQPAVAGSALAAGAAARRLQRVADLCCTAASFDLAAAACLAGGLLSRDVCSGLSRGALACTGCNLVGACVEPCEWGSLGTAAPCMSELADNSCAEAASA